MKRIRQPPIFIMTFWVLPMLLALFVPDFCYAGLKWKSIGPGGGKITALAIDPGNSSIIYAGTWFGGVFKSANGGTTWSAINSGLTYSPNIAVSALAIDPGNSNIIYAGTLGGVFKSTNGGGNGSAILTNSSADAVAIDLNNSNIIYAGSYGGGVFKSTNAGSTWSAINSGLTCINVEALAINPGNSNIVYTGTDGGGAFKSIIEQVVDFDGDAKTDIAVYHAATGLWFIKPSTGAGDWYVGYGGTGYMPVNLDYLHGYVY